MAIDFPASPTPGQVFQGYYWDDVKKAWRSSYSSAGSVITSTTTPTGAKNGDLWYNTNDGTLYVYFDNGITAYWTEIKANSSLNTTLGNRVTTLESGKANLAGGNTFTGNQTFSSGLISAANSPSFYAYRSSDLTGFNASTQTNPVVFNAATHNVGNYYNTSTGLFTAPVSGRYIFFAGIYSSLNPEQIWPIINGVRGQSLVVLAGYQNITGTGVYYLNANDTFGVTPWTSGNTSFTIYSNIYHTHLRGAYIG